MWDNGYWKGKMIDGYPATYFDNGHLEFPWEKNIEVKNEKQMSMVSSLQSQSNNDTPASDIRGRADL